VTSLLLTLLLAAPDAGALAARPVTVTADRLELFNKEARAVYTGHAKATRDALTVTCERLEVFFSAARDVERIVATGDVVAVEGDREARGDQAEFDNRTGVLTVRGQPRGRQGRREVDGEVVTFATGTERLEVTKAKTRVTEADERRLAIDADLLVLENPKAEARWTGHVRAVRGKTTLLTPELLATYDDAGAVTRVQARGGVEVTEGDRWARGQRGDYDVARGVLVVTGKPEARQGKSRLRGSKVTFFSGTEFLEVENATTVIDTAKEARP
jgi:lipopolysaccharide transport protein LptA